ncbi:tRNA (adenosine(37)-N6)-threonylcarbamoyltransferase complex transferase subunit TsaD [Candidatus Marinamargulisbacteria bacterium SCGC AG-439-L15]|nr:tRNA (adenosine(37)-N6)-threonylcarbamoyltransferase complex transferase subunit TsaD [Candidatus Marinamargulisbacteria bacterium SCGC AG-439-L15]
MKLLGIETSCDETAVAIVEDGKTVLAEEIASQIAWHSEYGGVIPELASRLHVEKITVLIDRVCESSGLSLKDLDGIAVTYGPGLEGALLVGLSVAKTLSSLLKLPLIGVNHLHGHIYANFLLETPPRFPFITLIVSGGHTLLVLVKDYFDFECIGTTQDDACGEAFDKVARLLGLSYPGGPEIERHAKKGDPTAFDFPRPMLHNGLDFSFSGLKTAVAQQVVWFQKEKQSIPVSDIAASFQASAIDILVKKCEKACLEHEVSTLVLAGGVSANRCFSEEMTKMADSRELTLLVPPMALCTDNAAMIAVAAYYHCQQQGLDEALVSVSPNLSI